MKKTPKKKKKPTYRLYHVPGTGSAIVHACLHLAKAPYELIPIDYATLGPQGTSINDLNPLGQIPTLVLPSGDVMTESAAIALHLSEKFKRSGLAPSASDPTRPMFLRWLVYFVASMYPNFTYGDDPRRWVVSEAAQKDLRATTDAYNQKLWRVLEENITPKPWFLGKKFSILDIYVGVMTVWRPNRVWFEEHCPKMHALALRVDAHRPLRSVWKSNFHA